MESLPENDPLMSVDDNGDVVVPDAPDKYGWTKETIDDDTPHGTPEALGAATMAAAGRMLGRDGAEASAEDETPRRRPLNERLERVEKEFHFLPQTREELSDATGLISKDYAGGAATRLNIIFNHQKHLPDKQESLPRRTIERIIDRYAGFAENSQHQISMYRNFENMIVVTPRGQYLPADSVGVFRDWDIDASTRAPVLRLARAEALHEYVETKGETPDPYAIEKGRGSSESAVKQRAAEYMANHRVHDILTDIQHAIREQGHRHDFWIKMLTEATDHRAAASSAFAALRRLGVITDDN